MGSVGWFFVGSTIRIVIAAMASNDKEIKDVEASVERTVSVDVGAEKKIVGARDVDEALKFLEQNEHVVSIEDVDEKKLLRKIDWMLMPLMFLCYFLQYSDKTLSEFGIIPWVGKC